jgi:hypothetical protein
MSIKLFFSHSFGFSLGAFSILLLSFFKGLESVSLLPQKETTHSSEYSKRDHRHHSIKNNLFLPEPLTKAISPFDRHCFGYAQHKALFVYIFCNPNVCWYVAEIAGYFSLVERSGVLAWC